MKAKVLIVLVLLICVGNQIATAQSKFEQLKSWVGKYPSGTMDLKTGAFHKVKVKFFALPEIKPSLIKLLSPRDYTLVTKEYGVETPITLVEHYLTISVCRPHNCGSDHADCAVDLNDGSIYVKMRISDKDRWFPSKEKCAFLPEQAGLGLH